MCWRNRRERVAKWFLHCVEERNLSRDGGEEQTELGGLYCHLGPCDDVCIAEGHVWVRGPAETGICVEDHSLCYHPKAVWMPGVWATPRGHTVI